mmetsp:Transcript_48040/g.121090  ORF Transcript_48040/g.121090 Transcript_48040/m.121090 type:complete len:225 (+) Transcript_48040:856-1530(+)
MWRESPIRSQDAVLQPAGAVAAARLQVPELLRHGVDRVSGDSGHGDLDTDHVHALHAKQGHPQDLGAGLEGDTGPAKAGGRPAGCARELLVRWSPLDRGIKARLDLEPLHHEGVQPAWSVPVAALPCRGLERNPYRRPLPHFAGLAWQDCWRDGALLARGQSLVHGLWSTSALGAHGGEGRGQIGRVLRQPFLWDFRGGACHLHRLPHRAPRAVRADGDTPGPS